jgi:hypothetical protein
MRTSVIVKVPTPELWGEVEQRCFDYEIGWWSGGFEHADYWNDCKEKSCLHIENNKLSYSDESYYLKDCLNTPIITAEEFLEDKQPTAKQNNAVAKIMYKVSSMMKRMLDADAQTLYKAGYINGDLELTDKGRTALNTIIFVANKSELVKMAQEELDEEKK